MVYINNWSNFCLRKCESLILLCRRFLSNKNQAINFLYKSMDLFLYDRGASVINESNKELKIATITVWKDEKSLSTVVECTKKFESPLTGKLQCLKNFLKHVQCYLLVNCFRLRYVSKKYVNGSLIVIVLKLPVKNCHIDIAMSRCFGNV